MPEGANIDTDDDGNERYNSEDEGSDGSGEILSEDINTLSINNPNGFMGRGSEVSWLKILRRELNIDDEIENEQLRISREMKGDTAGPHIDMVGSFPFQLHVPCYRPAAALTLLRTFRRYISPRRY
jgi:hypothetical protein